MAVMDENFALRYPEDNPKSSIRVTFDVEQLTTICASIIAAGIWASPHTTRTTFSDVAEDAIDQAKVIRKQIREGKI